MYCFEATTIKLSYMMHIQHIIDKTKLKTYQTSSIVWRQLLWRNHRVM